MKNINELDLRTVKAGDQFYLGDEDGRYVEASQDADPDHLSGIGYLMTHEVTKTGRTKIAGDGEGNAVAIIFNGQTGRLHS